MTLLTLSFDRASQSSLSDTVYLLIRERILRGQLRPGQVLSRRRMAEEFGREVVLASEQAMSRSRSPFRDASALTDYIVELLAK